MTYLDEPVLLAIVVENGHARLGEGVEAFLGLCDVVPASSILVVSLENTLENGLFGALQEENGRSVADLTRKGP